VPGGRPVGDERGARRWWSRWRGVRPIDVGVVRRRRYEAGCGSGTDRDRGRDWPIACAC